MVALAALVAAASWSARAVEGPSDALSSEGSRQTHGTANSDKLMPNMKHICQQFNSCHLFLMHPKSQSCCGLGRRVTCYACGGGSLRSPAPRTCVSLKDHSIVGGKARLVKPGPHLIIFTKPNSKRATQRTRSCQQDATSMSAALEFDALDAFPVRPLQISSQACIR